MIEPTLVLLILLLATVFDLRERRIPNALIVCSLAAALACAMLTGDLSALLTALAGAGIGLLVLLPFFVLHLVGAGDVKLMGVVGAFLGAPALLPITIYTFIAGGLLAVAAILQARTGQQTLHSLRLMLFATAARVRGIDIRLSEIGLASTTRVPYALAITAGVVVWLLGRS